MAKAPSNPRKAAAPKPSPTPAPAQAEASTSASSEGTEASTAPTSPVTTSEQVAASVASTETGGDPAPEAQGTAIGEPIAQSPPGEGDDRHELLRNAELAVRAAIDALDEVARSGVFFAETPADKLIIATAQQGFDAMRKVMADTEAAVGAAMATLRYEGLERRAFVVVDDVELDGTRYGPSAAEPEKPAPLTAQQHAELVAVGMIDAAWDDGEPVETD